MSFKTGIDDDYPYDRFLTFTEAAEILGAGNHTRVRNLVLAGKLIGYEIPGISKLRVKKSHVLQLINGESSEIKVRHENE